MKHVYRFFCVVSFLTAAALSGFPVLAAYDDGPRLVSKQFAPTASSLSASMPTTDGDFSTTALASLGRQAQSVLRLESSWNRQFDDGQSLRIGDSISDPGSWGSAVRFAGLQFGTPFNLRSDLIDNDRVALTGVAVLPSVVDTLVQSSDTNMRQRGLTVSGKAAVVGANSLAFTARDADGRTVTMTRSLVAKDMAADVGCKQFSTGIGRARRDYAIVSDNYGALFANSTLTCGTDSGYTIEAHGEYLQGDARLAGVDIRRAMNNIGTASIAMAASQKEDLSGWLVRAGWQRSNDLFEVNLRARLQSADFRELGQSDATDPITSRMLASVGAKLSNRSTLAFAYANQTTASLQRTDVVAVTHTIELGSKGSKGKISIVADHAVHDDHALHDDSTGSVKVSYVRKLSD